MFYQDIIEINIRQKHIKKTHIYNDNFDLHNYILNMTQSKSYTKTEPFESCVYVKKN